MRGFRFNLFLLVLIAAIVALGWGLQRDLSQPNYESMIEGQMARTPEDLVGWLTRETSFPHGAFLLTGTGIVPPDDFTLASGDDIRITIDGIGTLANRVA